MYTFTQGRDPQGATQVSSVRPVRQAVQTHPVLRLQRVIGNQAVQRMLQTDAGLTPTASPHLGHDFSKISVLSPTVQPRCACGSSAASDCAACQQEREGTSKPGAADTADISRALSNDVLRSSGQPLDPATRQDFEPRFGVDFSSVRVHTDEKAAASARSENALAYTAGRDLVFGEGQYAPGTPDGRRLLAHELTHVVQQGAFGHIEPRSIGRSADHFEREAEDVSRAITKPGFPPAGARLAPIRALSTSSMLGGAIQHSPDPDVGAKRNEARLADLARDPRKAHRAWRNLKTEEKSIVLDKMARHYGAAFADQFREVAEHGKPQFGETYWQPHTGPSPEQLKARGWRFLEMENTGNAAFEVELWVNPSGNTTRRDVSTYQFGQTQAPPTKQPPPVEPPCPESGFTKELEEIKKKLWPAIADFEANVERLASNPPGADRAPIEADISTTRNIARNLITDLANLQKKADEAGDDECMVDESSNEWSAAMEDYARISQRYNGINQSPPGGSNASP